MLAEGLLYYVLNLWIFIAYIYTLIFSLPKLLIFLQLFPKKIWISLVSLWFLVKPWLHLFLPPWVFPMINLIFQKWLHSIILDIQWFFCTIFCILLTLLSNGLAHSIIISNIIPLLYWKSIQEKVCYHRLFISFIHHDFQFWHALRY